MTQLQYALQGIITDEMKKAAECENVSPEEVRNRIADGSAVLPKNVKHNILYPKIVGKGFSVKVNVNIGTSMDYTSFEEELQKADISFKYGTDAIMILSTWGDLRMMRRELVKISPVSVGSVPIYDAAVRSYTKNKKVIDFSEDDFIEMVREHAEDGIDFMTIHVGVTLDVLKKLQRTKRILKVVSRGGSIVAGWMIENESENPFYQHFDKILEIAQEYDITLSLGDGMRPGALVDGTDDLQLEELFTLGELVLRAREKGVQVMVEGPGHLPIDQIEMNMKLAKKIAHDAPFFVLGPVVTDCAPGYDHIVSAIGGAIAGYHGADFLCYVTPAEHASLPTVEDVKQGLIITKIAAQAVNSALRRGNAIDREEQMAIARKDFLWDKQIELSIDKGERLKEYREKRPYSENEGCSMCGPFCAIKIVEDYTKK